MPRDEHVQRDADGAHRVVALGEEDPEMRSSTGRKNRNGIGTSLLATWLIAQTSAAALAQTTTRVSLSSAGAQGDELCTFPRISADGRYVAFYAWATNLVPGDTNATVDAFVRDRRNGTTSRVSVSTAGGQGDGASYSTSISGDGRYVAFQSAATNLVAGDTNAVYDVFLRDRQSGTTTRLSVDALGEEGDGDSFVPSLSSDGRYMAFGSRATNLVPGDVNGRGDVFVRDLQTGTIVLASVDSAGVQGDDESLYAALSADGRYVAFVSYASNLVPGGDANGATDVFVRDLQNGTTTRVSVDSNGVPGDFHSSYFVTPAISADGRYVAFESQATNLAPGDTNLSSDVFLRDVLLGTTTRVSVGALGDEFHADSWTPSLSADARYVAFASDAGNVVPGDANASADVFVCDLTTGTMSRASVDSAGAEAEFGSQNADISADGRFVAFASFAGNLVQGDSNPYFDVFVRDRIGGTSFTSLCEPGIAGVLGCPCSNPPAGSGRGCDNSAATGGAMLSAAGASFLSSDSLVFTTSGEKPTATSVLLQGTTVVAGGATYGQGVRCVGGTLKRLFTKTASGGSITAPDFAADDPTVSARSAGMGSPISPGQSRSYLVFYRDPTVLGGCPAGSTFNATQTGRIDWAP
jgi:Tol biopolymer transport system component